MSSASRSISEAVRTLIASDGLVGSTEPDLEEGEPVRSILTGHAAGYQLCYQEGRVNTAFLYVVPSQLDKGYIPFVGTLPGDLLRSDTRAAVLRRFGTPQRSGEAFTHRLFGRQGAWDRFFVGPHCIHFQYVEQVERIGRVTIMLADRAP